MKQIFVTFILIVLLMIAAGLCSCGESARPVSAAPLTAEEIQSAERKTVRELADKLVAEMQARTLTAEREWEEYVSESSKKALSSGEKSEYLRQRELSLYAMPDILSYTLEVPRLTENGLYAVTAVISYSNGVTKPVSYTFSPDGLIIAND